MWVAKFTHHTVGSFLRNWIIFLIYINRLYILTQPKEGKDCEQSSTSFGLVDRFKGNYSATSRAIALNEY